MLLGTENTVEIKELFIVLSSVGFLYITFFSLRKLGRSVVRSVKDTFKSIGKEIERAGKRISDEISRSFEDLGRETARIFGIKGKYVLGGDITNQRLTKDDDLAKNVQTVAILDFNKGKSSAPKFVMDLLIPGKLKFSRLYNYGKNTYSKGLPTSFVILSEDKKEEIPENAQNLIETLEGSNVTLVDSYFGSVKELQYMFSCLYSKYNYDPIKNTLEYDDTIYSYNRLESKTEHIADETEHTADDLSPTYLYTDYIISGVQFNVVYCSVHKITFKEIVPTSLPPETDNEGNPVEKEFVFEGIRIKTVFKGQNDAVIHEKNIVESTNRYELVVKGTEIGSSSETLIDGYVFDYTNPIEKLVYEDNIAVTETVIGTVTAENGTLYDKIKIENHSYYYFKTERNAVTTNYNVNLISRVSDYYTIEYREQGTYSLQAVENQSSQNLYTNTHSSPVNIINTFDTKRKREDGQEGTYSTDCSFYLVSEFFEKNSELVTNRAFTYIEFYKNEYPQIPYYFIYDATHEGMLGKESVQNLLSDYNSYSMAKCFPIMPLKENSVWFDSFEESYKKEVKQLMRCIDISPDSILEELKKDANEDKITDACVQFCVSLQQTEGNESVAEYLWYLFDTLDEITPSSYTVLGEKKLRLMVGEDSFAYAVSWQVAGSGTHSGTMNQEYDFTVHPEGFERVGGFFGEALKKFDFSTLELKKKIDENTFESFVVMQMYSTHLLIRDGLSEVVEKNMSEDSFMIPVLADVVKMISPYRQTEFLHQTLCLTVYASEKHYLKYYETKEFATFLRVTAIVIAVVTFGAGVKASGFLVALSQTAVKIAIYYGIKLALEYIYKQTDNEFMRIVATAAAVAGASYSIYKIDADSFNVFSALAASTDIITFSMELDLQIKKQELAEQQIQAEKEYADRMEEYEGLMEQYDNSLEPFDILKINEAKNWKPYLIGIDAYYEIALGRLAMNYSVTYEKDRASNFYEEQLRLGQL